VLSFAWVLIGAIRDKSAVDKRMALTGDNTPLSLCDLLSMSTEKLSRVDIGLMNLLCAVDLHGKEAPDANVNLKELDRMAARVKTETERHYRKFQSQPKEFNNSEAYFRVLCLVTVLQQDFRVHYNPNRAKPNDGPIEPNDSFFADSADIFLHGLVGDCRMGTCASLPVLYVAVGRRLGYPLKLVAAKTHLFVRWDEERERLNIEATTQGLTTFDDDYYRHWPFSMTPEEERTERYLTSLGPAEELSVFLSLRTQCLLAASRIAEAALCQEQVYRLAPHSSSQREILEHLKIAAHRQTKSDRKNQSELSL
jgi:hypothetical protein